MKLKELADRTGCTLRGNGDAVITGPAPVECAGPATVTLLYMKKYLRRALESGATALVTSEEFAADLDGRNLLLSDNPYAAFSRVLTLFAPVDRHPSGISAGASIAGTASVDESATVMQFAFIGEGVRIGKNTVVYPNVYVGSDATVGDDCVLYPGVVVRDRCVVGNRCVLHPGVVIGADGFGFTTDGDGHHKVPQIGRAVIEDDVEIGANTTIDRGTVGDTVIGRGAKLDNLVMVGHNVRIGEHSLLVAQTGIAGSTKVGSWAMFGGQAGITGHLEIGNGVRIGAQSGVMRNLEDGAVVGGSPAVDKTKWLRHTVMLDRLEHLLKELNGKKKQQG